MNQLNCHGAGTEPEIHAKSMWLITSLAGELYAAQRLQEASGCMSSEVHKSQR